MTGAADRLPAPFGRLPSRLGRGIAAGLLLLAAGLHAAPIATHLVRKAGEWLRDPAPRSAEAYLEGRWGEYYRRVRFLRDHTPEDAVLVLPPPARGTGRIGNRGLSEFFLFPRLTRRHAAQAPAGPPVYRVELPDAARAASTAEAARLPDGFGVRPVRERRGEPSPPPRDFTRRASRPSERARAGLELLLVGLSGAWLVARSFGERSGVGFAASAFLVGGVLQAGLHLVASFLGLPLTSGARIAFSALLAAPCAVRLARGGSLLRDGPGEPTSRHISRHTSTVWTLLAALVACAFLASLFAFAMARPILEWDACAIWGIKAKAIFAFGNWSGLGRWGAWPEYPPLQPTLMAIAAGGGEPMAKAIPPLLACALYGIVYEALRDVRMPEPLRILLPLLLLAAPMLHRHAIIAYANLGLAVYVTKAVTLFARGVRTGALPGPALALVLSGVVLTRPDGEVYLGYLTLLAGLWVWLAPRSRRRAAFRSAAWLGLPVAADLAWKLYYTLHLKSELSSSWFGAASQAQQLGKFVFFRDLPGPAAILEGLRYFLVHSLSPEFWGLVPLAFVALLVWRRGVFLRAHAPECAFLALGIAGLLFLSFFTGYNWGYDYYYGVTFKRLLMALVPTAFLCAVSGGTALLSGRGADEAPARV